MDGFGPIIMGERGGGSGVIDMGSPLLDAKNMHPSLGDTNTYYGPPLDDKTEDSVSGLMILGRKSSVPFPEFPINQSNGPTNPRNRRRRSGLTTLQDLKENTINLEKGVLAPAFSVNGRSKMNHLEEEASKAGSSCGGSISAVGDVSGEAVGAYLRSHPEFLEAYLMDHVELEQLERWMIRKTQRAKTKAQENGTNGKIIRKTSLSRWKFCVHADKRKMLQEMTQSLQIRPNKAHVLWELSQCIASAVNADGFNMYIADPSNQSLTYYKENIPGRPVVLPESGWSCEMGSGTWLCAWVAATRQPIRVSDPTNDQRFPQGSPFAQAQQVYHCMGIGVTQSDGELAAVLELYRKEKDEPFFEEDEEIVNSYLVWGGIALHYAELYHSMVKQRKLNDFILSVVKSIFQDMVSMDTLIMKVMSFAQKLVSADRASLFLVDAKNKQLYARIFDMTHASEFEEENPPQASKEIRFPIGTGIAGIVAQTGTVLNIPDAYADPRFNRTVDQLTGYVTKSILCMPIFIRGNVIGVMQMVNKNMGIFSTDDEESFEMFAVYCGLALHHAKLYDKIRRSEQKYKLLLLSSCH